MQLTSLEEQQHRKTRKITPVEHTENISGWKDILRSSHEHYLRPLDKHVCQYLARAIENCNVLLLESVLSQFLKFDFKKY